jgi:uncharacterized protein
MLIVQTRPFRFVFPVSTLTMNTFGNAFSTNARRIDASSRQVAFRSTRIKTILAFSCTRYLVIEHEYDGKNKELLRRPRWPRHRRDAYATLPISTLCDLCGLLCNLLPLPIEPDTCGQPFTYDLSSIMGSTLQPTRIMFNAAQHHATAPATRLRRWRTLFVSGSFLLLVPGFVLADSPSPTLVTPGASQTLEGHISLDATAHRRLPNTAADVTLGIQLDGSTVDAVSNLLSQHSQTLLDFLRQQGVERLQTKGVTFAPQTEPVRGGPDRIVGFTGQVFVSFRTTPEKLGTLLSESLARGANTVGQIEFTPLEGEIDTACRDLAIEATKSALERAEAIAQSTGERVIRIENINVSSEETVRPALYRAAKEANLSSPPIATEAGEKDISVRVSVQVGIESNSK